MGEMMEVVEVPLFSQVDRNVWLGGGPVDCLPPKTEYIISLHPWLEYTIPEGVNVLRVWLEDEEMIPGEALLVAIARWISAVRRIGVTLVHCQMGLNRSGLVLALAMMVDGASADQAIGHLRAARSEHVLFNKTFENWLRTDAVTALETY